MPVGPKPKITIAQKKFILENSGRIKQCVMAKNFNLSPSTINGIIKGRRGNGVITDTENFNLQEFAKSYRY